MSDPGDPEQLNREPQAYRDRAEAGDRQRNDQIPEFDGAARRNSGSDDQDVDSAGAESGNGLPPGTDGDGF